VEVKTLARVILEARWLWVENWLALCPGEVVVEKLCIPACIQMLLLSGVSLLKILVSTKPQILPDIEKRTLLK
jgi:hypothetical protein